MSVLGRPTVDQLPASREHTAIAVAWKLPRSAVADILPDPSHTRRNSDVVLAITITGNRTDATLIDHANRIDIPIELPAARVSRVDAGRWLHLDVTDARGRVLSASIDASNPTTTGLRYAVTGLLTRLGIPGGRASRPAIVDPADLG
ncbi:MAG: hypothetical protein AAGB48_01455 [Planctomycetota bacterium]